MTTMLEKRFGSATGQGFGSDEGLACPVCADDEDDFIEDDPDEDETIDDFEGDEDEDLLEEIEDDFDDGDDVDDENN